MRVSGWCGVLGLWLSSSAFAQTPPVPSEDDLQASDSAYWWSAPGPTRVLQLRPDVSVSRRVATTDLNGDGRDDTLVVARRGVVHGVLAEVSTCVVSSARPCPRRGLFVGEEDLNGWGVESHQVLVHRGRALILFAGEHVFGDYGDWLFSVWAYDETAREFRLRGSFEYSERIVRNVSIPRFRLRPAIDDARCLSGVDGEREVDRLCLDRDARSYHRVSPRAAPITPPR